ncbi:MAG: adenosylcobinamide-GDP ribazoletransferase [Geminicoccaceae bacterium]|nr:MAG: adenosylcobinamide-GDP ribazoletransferase [Geminicoccaceae bacterium]
MGSYTRGRPGGGAGCASIAENALAAAGQGGDVGEGLRVALVFLTRLPVGLGQRPPSLAEASPWFAVVGALLGLAAGLLFAGLSYAGMPSFPASLVVLAFLVIATGALHEDGLADCADALGPHDRAKRLEVMRDSRIGSFGAMALILVTLARVAGLSSLWHPADQVATLVVVLALSRGLLVPTMAVLSFARPDGLAARSGHPDKLSIALALAIPALLAFALLPPDRALKLLAVGVVVAIAWAWFAQRAYGGQTGDVLGAQQQLVEAALLLSLTVKP